MKTVLIHLILLSSFLSMNAQSYELNFRDTDKYKLAKWTSNTLPDIAIQYAKRDFLFEPKAVNIFHQTDLVYTFEREKLNQILRDQHGEIVCLYKPFTYVMSNGARYNRRLKKWGKYIEIYDQNDELVAQGSFVRLKNRARKVVAKIIKPTADDQALLSLMAIDLLEHYRQRNDPYWIVL